MARILNRGTVALTAAILAGGVFASMISIGLVGGGFSYATLILVLAGLLVGILVREVIVVRDLVTPAGIVAATGLLLFVLRPITVAATGVTSPGALADSRFFSPALQDAASVALAWCIVFFSAFAIVYYWRVAVAAGHLPLGAGRRPAPMSVPPTRVRREVSTTALQVISVLAALVAFGTTAMLVQSSGGISGYLSGISNRSEFLSGRSFLVFGYVPAQVALIANVLHRRHMGLKVWRSAPILLVLVALIVAGLAGGGRGPFIVGVALPLLLLKQVGPKPFSLRTIGIFGVVMLLFAVGYSVFVRGAQFDEGRSAAAFRSDPIGTTIEQITSGSETRPFDSLIRLAEVQAQPGFEYQWGATYAASPSWFVPRALWEDKPFGGGNTWFTSTYVPRYYGSARVETSVSAIGEAFGNFGWVGVGAAGVVFGLVGGAFSRERLARRSLLGATATVCLTGQMFSLVRGDLYQGGSITIATLTLVGVVYIVVTRRAKPVPKGSAPSRPTVRPEDVEPRTGTTSVAVPLR